MITPNMTSTIARIMFERDEAQKKLAIAIEALENVLDPTIPIRDRILQAEKALKKVINEK